MSKRETPPADDELEVSIFGPGRGESIVVHVPDGPWFVIDSFALKKVPVAKRYLSLLGVTKLDGVFLTHWHEDHTKGGAGLVEEYASSLRIVGLPGALTAREMASWVSVRLPNRTTARVVRDLVAVASALEKRSNLRRVLLHDGTVLSPHGSTWTLTALSPSADDCVEMMHSLTPFLPGFAGPPATRIDVNSGAAVLVLDVPGAVVVFGSDLDIGSGPTTGWQHIVAQHYGRLPCVILKVGHHGSPTAYHPPALDAMRTLSGPPLGAVTPFPLKTGSLPKAAEATKYKSKLAALHLTHRPNPYATTVGKTQRSVLPFTSYTKTSATSFEGVGQIRYRLRSGESRPRVEIFGSATQL